MLHPIWPTTCYCRGEIKTKELEEAKRAASTPRRFKFKSTRVAASVNKDSEAAPTPKSFKFSSGKRPHEEESDSSIEDCQDAFELGIVRVENNEALIILKVHLEQLLERNSKEDA